MNEQELKDAISDMQECRELIGKANMRLNNILTQRKVDMQKKLDDAYQKGLEDGKKAFDLLDAERDYEYQRGLNDAWDAARKINMEVDDGGLSVQDLGKIFKVSGNCAIMRIFTAKEAIAKIKKYEDKQNEIRVGDELKQVTDSGKETGLVCIVTYISGDNMNGIQHNGRMVLCSSQVDRWWKKTGRHFDVESILEEMQS